LVVFGTFLVIFSAKSGVLGRFDQGTGDVARMAGYPGLSIESWAARPTEIQICKSAVKIAERWPTFRTDLLPMSVLAILR
jgi:hypothetical protein